MKPRLIIGLFICLSLIQVITPLSMIVKRESALKSGEQFKFKAAPVDPYDAFRGRYVALQMEANYAPDTGLNLRDGQRVYALIGVDSQGFAKFTAVALSRPRGQAYLQVNVRYVSGDKVYLELPMNRYYMEESAAPKAETLYREHVQGGKQEAYVTVRIKEGFAVIEDLYVGGRRIEEAVKRARG